MTKIRYNTFIVPVSFIKEMLSSLRSSYTLVPATSLNSFNLWESGAVAIWLIYNLGGKTIIIINYWQLLKNKNSILKCLGFPLLFSFLSEVPFM